MAGRMEWVSDVAEADWLVEALGGAGGGFEVVPRGFDAYVRVFHPAGLPGAASGTGDGTDNGNDSDDAPLLPTPWREIAEAFGTTMHPLAQFASLTRSNPLDGTDIRDPSGREVDAPSGGSLPAPTLAALTGALAAHTRTPDRVIAGIWEGWGGLAQAAGYAVIFFDPRHPRRRPPRALRARQRRWNGSTEPGTGLLPREIAAGPKLEVPSRSYFLFAAPLDVYSRGTWPAIAPWVHDEDRGPRPHGEIYGPQSPSLLWPADRAWLISTEVDFDSTIVGCSRAAADELLALPQIEALEIEPDADLTWYGDEINPLPPKDSAEADDPAELGDPMGAPADWPGRRGLGRFRRGGRAGRRSGAG